MHGLFFRRSSSGFAIVVVAILLLASRESCGANIALSGFNEDIVTEIGASPFAHRFDGWGASLIEQGATDKSGRTATVGLPPSRQFVSATGSGVTYFLQPYDADNALRMGDGDSQTGTMTVVAGQYSALHILAASGTGGGTAEKQTGDVILNFVDGSVTLPGPYSLTIGVRCPRTTLPSAEWLVTSWEVHRAATSAFNTQAIIPESSSRLLISFMRLQSISAPSDFRLALSQALASPTPKTRSEPPTSWRSTAASSVPEPAALTLLTIGGLGLGGMAIRRRALQSLPLFPALCASAQPVSPIDRKRWRKSA